MSLKRLPIVLTAAMLAAPIAADAAIDTIGRLWEGFDPRALPLEVEVIDSHDEDGIRIERLYLTGEVFEGEKTRIYAILGRPLEGTKLPGVLHIRGGGQTAYVEWPRFWARRGHACVIFAFVNVTCRAGAKVSSRLVRAAAKDLAGATPSLRHEALIDAMETTDAWHFVPAYTDPHHDDSYFRAWQGPDGERGFTLDPALFPERREFHFGTYKPGDPQWRGAEKAMLLIDALADRLPERLEARAIRKHFHVDQAEYAAELVAGGKILEPAGGGGTATPGERITLRIGPNRLKDREGKPLASWDDVDCFHLLGTCPRDRAPVFQRLRWKE